MSIVLAHDLIFKEIDTIDAFEEGTGNFLFSLDELTDYSIIHSEESQPIRGRNGRIISQIKRNKSVSITGTNGIISSGMLAIQTGGEYKSGNTTIMWSDYLTVQSNHATTSFKAIGTIGAEITSVVVTKLDGSGSYIIRQGQTAVSGESFTYNPVNRLLTFDGIADGSEIVVYYNRKIEATTLVNDSGKSSGRAMLYVNGFAEDKCANVYRVQFFFPRVDFSGEFSIDLSDSQTVHRFEAIALAGACGAGSKYYTYNVFGVNAEDADARVGKYVYIGTDNKFYVGSDDKIYIDKEGA